MDVSYEGRVLTIGDKKINLELPIKEVLAHETGIILVNFNELIGVKSALPPGDPRVNCNIIGLDIDGNILWRIEQSKRVEVHEDSGETRFMLNYWMIRRLNTDGTVLVGDYWGMVYDLDPKTGMLSNKRYVR